GTDIVVRAVAILLAVLLIVLVLVADEIGEREAIVHGHVVDAAARAAAIVLELRRRSGHAVCQVADQVSLAAPEAAGRLAVEVVPFRPAGRKAADLVAAGADVPWLRDQLDVA